MSIKPILFNAEMVRAILDGWKIVDIPHGMPIYNTGCGKIRLSCSTGIDNYCNACGRKIKVVDDKKVGENNEQ